MLNELNLTPEEEQQILGGVAESEPATTPEPATTQEPVHTPTSTPDPTQFDNSTHDKQDDRKVPLAALHEARAEIKELRRQNQETASKLSALEQLKQDIIALRESKKEPVPPVPDFNEDPLGNLSTRINQQEQKISTYDMESARRNQEMEVQKQHNNLINTVAYHEQEFQKISPDYLDAVQYMRDFRKNELSMFGVTDPHQIAEEIRKNTIALASFAVSQNKNPAEMMYTLAKQYGYKPKSTEPSPTTPSVIDTVTKGESAASKTLSGKGVTEGNLTAEGLLNLDGAEFEAAWSKLFGR